MVWSQIEATNAHLTYLVVAAFLGLYTLFSVFIRNRLHLSEPPLALITGIIFGPRGLGAVDPLSWNFEDDVMQEFTRVIAGLQCFVIGLELPKRYMPKHYPSILWMLGPVMAFGWLICAVFVKYILDTEWATALTIAACLTPTDPVLAASILSNSHFSTRVPKRMKHLLSAESGCNDGAAFPFLYVGLSILTKSTPAGAVKKWFLITILWQCVMGIFIGGVFGYAANYAVRFSDRRKLIGPTSFVVFYLVLAVLSVGIGSTLGLDDFLVAFSAGVAFSHDGWFAQRTKQSNLNNILDLLLNSTFFVYLGTVIPWADFSNMPHSPNVTVPKLFGLLVLILLFRRLPAVLALKRWIPDIHTWAEAFFAGHFGPMGVGALFLSIEARAQLETGESLPLPSPDDPAANPHNVRASHLMYPVICFIVLGSILVHGLSAGVISVYTHLARDKESRAHAPGLEREPLGHMDHDDNEGSDDSEEESEVEDGWEERRSRLVLQ